MRRQLGNVISVLVSAVRLLGLKLILNKDFTAPWIQRISPNVVLEFSRKAKVRFGRKVRIHSGTKIKARGGACMDIGDNVRVNYNCIFVAHEHIEIGDGTEFGPSVYIYDHDHDYRAGLKNDKFRKSAVVIGKNCWIGANTVILRGTKLGDNCVVGAGCVIKGDYPAGSVIVQKRETTVICAEN